MTDACGKFFPIYRLSLFIKVLAEIFKVLTDLGGFPGLVSAATFYVRELIVNKNDFDQLMDNSAHCAPLRINGEVHTHETFDTENLEMLMIPEGGKDDPLVREKIPE